MKVMSIKKDTKLEIIRVLSEGEDVLVPKEDVGDIFSDVAPGSFFNKPLRNALTFSKPYQRLDSYLITVTDSEFVKEHYQDCIFDWDSLDW